MNKIYVIFLLGYVFLLIVLIASVLIPIQLESELKECELEKIEIIDRLDEVVLKETGFGIKDYYRNQSLINFNESIKSLE
jgi:hypothetical protein